MHTAPLRHRVENLSVIISVPFLFLLLALVFEYSGLDIWWEAHFYDAQHQIWPYRGHWLFDKIIHSGGQRLDWFIALTWLLLFLFVNFKKQFHPYRKILLFFFVATAIGPILVGIGKNFTHIYSPWDLNVFNGMQNYIKMLDHVPAGAARGHAFPAGHASGGYCFLSVYFVLLRFRSNMRGYGLFGSLLLGVVYGVGQQVRGAHFPSHDLVTIGICWAASLVCYFLFYPEEWQALKKNENSFFFE